MQSLNLDLACSFAVIFHVTELFQAASHENGRLHVAPTSCTR